MKIELDLAKPIYQQIIDEIKRSVARGDLRPGDKLPSHRDLAQKAGVNPNTVQRAYREMEQAELVETLRGQGTFVKDNPRLLREIRTGMAHRALAAFIKEMRGLGFRDEEILELVQDGLKGIKESVVQQIQEIEVSMNEHLGNEREPAPRQGGEPL
ncbi:MAG: GntR family transcriptional regulator [Firmicutes bacterium]|nr:GntR family transcriptional regulator [Bacillota bacterium]MDH7494862.1 GntR family transcriptional regulator [Bacillota bacterium]